MILTVTPNPSIDRTITVGELAVGEVNRATQSRTDPGGKGVNVARALAANSHACTALTPLGGPSGTLLSTLLDTAEVAHTAVNIEGETRTNVAIVDPRGVTTKVNETGPALTDTETQQLQQQTLAAAKQASWLVLCGSLPPGTPADFYATLTRQHNGPVAVDTSGLPLREAVTANPTLIKPNREELEELTGKNLPTLGHILEAAHEIAANGTHTVVVSLGADGAVAVTTENHWFAKAAVDTPQSTVGAGDCLLAGMLAALDNGQDTATALAQGVAWGAAAVSLPGSQVPAPADIAKIRVTTGQPPLDTPLT